MSSGLGDRLVQRATFFSESSARNFQRFDRRTGLLLLIACLLDLHFGATSAALKLGGLPAQRRDLSPDGGAAFLENGELGLKSGKIAPEIVGLDTKLLTAPAA